MRWAIATITPMTVTIERRTIGIREGISVRNAVAHVERSRALPVMPPGIPVGRRIPRRFPCPR
jgi:hypothetical protein